MTRLPVELHDYILRQQTATAVTIGEQTTRIFTLFRTLISL